MTDELAGSGDTGTQQLNVGETSTDNETVVQNLPAKGGGGGEKELQKWMQEVQKLSAEIGLLKIDNTEANDKVAAFEKVLTDHAEQIDGLKRLVQFHKDQALDLNDKYCKLLREKCGATAVVALNVMRVEMEVLRASKETAEADVADLQVSLADAQNALAGEMAATKLIAEELRKKLAEVTRVAQEARARIADLEARLHAAEKAESDARSELSVANGDVDDLKSELKVERGARLTTEARVATLLERGLFARLRNTDTETVLGG